MTARLTTPRSVIKSRWGYPRVPMVCAHRGGGLVYPENSMEAFTKMAAENRTYPLELDIFALTDGSLAIMHDNTVDRTTTGTGNVASFNETTFRALTLDCSSWFLPSWPNSHPPMVEDLFALFGEKALYVCEIKNLGVGAPLVDLVESYGLQSHVLVGTWYMTNDDVTVVQAAGIPTALITYADQAAAAAAAGHSWVIQPDVTTSPVGYTANAHAAGLKVQVNSSGYLRHIDYDTWEAEGADSIQADDPCYLTRQHRLIYFDGMGAFIADPYATKTYWPGQIAERGDGMPDVRGSWVGTDRWGYAAGAPGGADWVLQGWGCPVPWSGNYTMDFDLTYDEVAADPTRWAGVSFSDVTDIRYNTAARTGCDGYLVLVRINGGIVLYRDHNGVLTQIGTAASAAIAEGSTIHLQIAVTPTAVTVKRTDVDPDVVVTVADTTYRGGYFHFGYLGAGCAFSWSNVVVRPG